MLFSGNSYLEGLFKLTSKLLFSVNVTSFESQLLSDCSSSVSCISKASSIYSSDSLLELSKPDGYLDVFDLKLKLEMFLFRLIALLFISNSFC